MRKILNILLSVVLLFSISACGSKENRREEIKTSEKNESTALADENDEIEEDISETPALLNSTYKVPLVDLYINVPAYQQMEKGFTEIYIEHDVKFVAITALRKEQVSTTGEAHDLAFETFKDNIHNYCHINSIDLAESTEQQINGIDVLFYEGNLSCEENENSYIVGYSFVFNNVPCNITGAVIDKEFNDSMKEEIKETVEAMMQSVRSEQ